MSRPWPRTVDIGLCSKAGAFVMQGQTLASDWLKVNMGLIKGCSAVDPERSKEGHVPSIPTEKCHNSFLREELITLNSSLQPPSSSAIYRHIVKSQLVILFI